MAVPCSLGYEELRLRIVSEDVLRAGIFSVHDREYILCDWARGGLAHHRVFVVSGPQNAWMAPRRSYINVVDIPRMHTHRGKSSFG